jgi:hypothetical protein
VVLVHVFMVGWMHGWIDLTPISVGSLFKHRSACHHVPGTNCEGKGQDVVASTTLLVFSYVQSQGLSRAGCHATALEVRWKHCLFWPFINKTNMRRYLSQPRPPASSTEQCEKRMINSVPACTVPYHVCYTWCTTHCVGVQASVGVGAGGSPGLPVHVGLPGDQGGCVCVCIVAVCIAPHIYPSIHRSNHPSTHSSSIHPFWCLLRCFHLPAPAGGRLVGGRSAVTAAQLCVCAAHGSFSARTAAATTTEGSYRR